MIFGGNRDKAIENIKKAAENGDFYAVVEPDDPYVSPEQMKALANNYLAARRTVLYKIRAFFARKTAGLFTYALNKKTKIIGIEKLSNIKGGAVITSNHFSPADSTPLRLMAKKMKRRVSTVAKVSNLAMGGIIGFLMNYADIIPLYNNPHYMSRDFNSVLSEALGRNEFVIIYPEQEMWFNYRKPRPPKRGVYYMAAKAGVPVISCFIEMTDLDEMDNEKFHKVAYTLHILGVIYPSPDKSPRENSIFMSSEDYALKTAAYEKIYGKPLDYCFEKSDIGGLA